MKSKSRLVFVLFLSACGGGGGGGAPAAPVTPAASVNLSADPTSVLLTNTTTLSWSTSNATSCSASGAWSGTKDTSGSEAVTISTAGNNSFTLSCTGAGGSGSASVTVEGYRNTDGVVVDGYISGAEVCIDEDESWTCDSSESSTTSDNDGKFTIKYANGNLVSIGGTDLDSQTLLDNLLITHKLTGHSDFKAVTPVTSVAAFMTDASLVNAALGIDSSIDVFTFDPVANKGDGGINDYLYEKGNQLTVLAYALQNITNDLNTGTETTQDYFKAITDEIEKEYAETSTKVDIETEAFITKVLNNVIAAKTLTISDDAKANTTKALSGVMPIIEVKSSDDLTTSVIRFAVSTLQTDIQAIANGTSTAETIASYTTDVLTYIATDQNIDADEITPDISAIADSATTSEDTTVDINVLVNDSFITTAPITVTAANGSNGSIVITANIVSYTPNTDFNGTDTFSYTITQGDKTSSADVSITVEAVNDAPSIDSASTIQVAENQTAVATISVSDVDEDELTLTLAGTDADSFDLSTDNVLTFKEAPDFETKSSYSITLTLTDGTETVSKDISVAVTNVNDVAPVFTSEATFSAAENQTAIGSVTATDADGDSLTFTVSGTELAITSTGVLTFASAPDYETKSSYTATVTATDGANLTTQNVTVNITNVNDIAPVFTSEATFSAAENQTAIGSVTATDADGDSLTFTVSGTELAITSTGVLTFASAPDYETKSSYTATVTATDGANLTTQNITINITDVSEVFSFKGKTIDGYIQGATVYLDQNFNFRPDTGELSAVTGSDGSFTISTDDMDLYNCLKSRPIVADVPVGAIDSSLGEVTKAYSMVLPSISDTGNSSIVISPFTSLLGDAVIQAKSSSSIKDELTLAEGCSNIGDGIALNITSELNQIKNTLSSSLNISYDDLVIDFIADTSNGTITETSAQNIAKFFPYFKQLTDEFDSELSAIHNKTINTDVSIKKDSINSILADSAITEIPVSFSAIYKTEPNDQGWFIQEKITAFGGKINTSGEMIHYTCFGDSENCTTSDIGLVSLRDASQRYTRTSSFINNSYNPSTYNYQLVVEDEQRVDFDFDGNPISRICILQNWLYLVPVNERENFTTNDRYNTGVASGSEGNDKCVEELSGKDEALFVALVDKYDDGVNFEEIDIRIRNADYSKSTFFTNRLNDVYNNRSNINVDPLIQEIASVPRTFKAMNILRDKLSTTSTDVIRIYWTKRNSSSQITESSMMLLSHNPDNDNFEYATYENSDTGSIRTEVINSSGQQARDDLFSTIDAKSAVFNNEEFNGTTAVVMPNSSPVFTSNSSFTVAENQTSAANITVTDADSDSISFSLSGTDADSFAISSSGALTFNNAPDYETKDSYSLIITASDGTASVSQTVTITISNINEVPQISALSSNQLPDENQVSVVTVSASDPDASTTLAYSLSGTDSSLFAISSSGVINFQLSTRL